MGDLFLWHLPSNVMINIATYNQHASKRDETTAYIILQTKVVSGRNTASVNAIPLSLRWHWQAGDGTESSFRAPLLKWSTFQSGNWLLIVTGVLIMSELTKKKLLIWHKTSDNVNWGLNPDSVAKALCEPPRIPGPQLSSPLRWSLKI